MSDSPRALVETDLDDTIAVLSAIRSDSALVGQVAEVADLCIAAIRAGHKILFAGNGGSAADSLHLSAELVGRYGAERRGLPALALNADISALTAIGNDYGYDKVFARQVEALGSEGDVLIAISTSGKSRNLVLALETARAKGMVTIGMTGKTGGDMLALCDLCLRVPSTSTPKVQEAQILLGHSFCNLIERAFLDA